MLKFLSVIAFSIALFTANLSLSWADPIVTDNGNNVIIGSDQENILIDITAAGIVIDIVTSGVKVSGIAIDLVGAGIILNGDGGELAMTQFNGNTYIKAGRGTNFSAKADIEGIVDVVVAPDNGIMITVADQAWENLQGVVQTNGFTVSINSLGDVNVVLPNGNVVFNANNPSFVYPSSQLNLATQTLQVNGLLSGLILQNVNLNEFIVGQLEDTNAVGILFAQSTINNVVNYANLNGTQFINCNINSLTNNGTWTGGVSVQSVLSQVQNNGTLNMLNVNF